jgi:hypothetical protein
MARLTLIARVWIKSIATICQNISSLTLNWGNQDLIALNKASPLDIVSVFALLHPHAPNLVALKLIGGVLDGDTLSGHLEQVAASLPKKLAGLTVDSCVGLSRADCKHLGPMVENLHIFRSKFVSRLRRSS